MATPAAPRQPAVFATSLHGTGDRHMRAHQIMTRSVISITPNATILEAANTMLRYHVSGLPVVDAVGKLVGIVSEGDFIRRSEIGTQRKRGRWLKFLLSAGAAATDYVHEHARSFRSHDQRSDHRHRRRDAGRDRQCDGDQR